MSMTRVATVQSDNGPSQYVISRLSSGEFACSCMGWTRHVPRRDCKHISRYKFGQVNVVQPQTVRAGRAAQAPTVAAAVAVSLADLAATLGRPAAAAVVAAASAVLSAPAHAELTLSQMTSRRFANLEID